MASPIRSCWRHARSELKEAVEELGIEYDIAPGGGAFYGPKLDFHLRDCIGRTWQCGTVQLDFQMPQRFDLTYTGADGEKHRPVMIHRTVFGSIERFMGVLIEHFEGKLPLWLAPVQVKIISVSEKHNETAWKLADEIEAAGLRTEVDARNEKTGYKVREAILARDSYIIVVGEKEATSDMLTVRSSKAGDMGEFPYGRQFIPCMKDAAGDQLFKAVHDLFVYGFAAFQIQLYHGVPPLDVLTVLHHIVQCQEKVNAKSKNPGTESGTFAVCIQRQQGWSCCTENIIS